MAKTSRTRSELRRVQLELHATRNHAQHLSEKHKKVRVENALLKVGGGWAGRGLGCSVGCMTSRGGTTGNEARAS